MTSPMEPSSENPSGEDQGADVEVTIIEIDSDPDD